jgi:serine/threonine protein phosphatase 1
MNEVQCYPRNDQGRDFAVGDIHGCYTLLESALTDADFDQDRDRLFSVGDLVDRGPESERVREWLSQPWFHAIRGNHEDMAIRWFRDHASERQGESLYRYNGGGWFIDLDRVLQERIVAALEALPVAIEVETDLGTIGIVHADCPASTWQGFTALLRSPRPDVRKDAIDAALWSRDRYLENRQDPVEGVRAVIVGHTPMDEATVLGNVHYIDTRGWAGGAFTLLELGGQGQGSAR